MDEDSLYNKKLIFFAYAVAYSYYVNSLSEGNSVDESKNYIKKHLIPVVNMIEFDVDEKLQNHAVNEVCGHMIATVSRCQEAYKENPLDPIEFAGVASVEAFPDTTDEELVEMIQFTYKTLHP